jgi:hypothetical protein
MQVEVRDGQHAKLLQRIPMSAEALTVSRDGHYFATAKGKSVSIWELR